MGPPLQGVCKIREDAQCAPLQGVCKIRERVGILGLLRGGLFPDGRFLRAVHGFGSLATGFLYSCRKHFAERRALAAHGAVFRFKRVLGLLLAFATLHAWTRLWYGWNALFRAGRGSRLVSCPVGRRHYFGELCPREEMFGRRAGTFEGRTVPLPPGVERYLTRLYGADYMTPPPPERRERHVVYAASPSEGPA